jgi:hypothetical protein
MKMIVAMPMRAFADAFPLCIMGRASAWHLRELTVMAEAAQ